MRWAHDNSAFSRGDFEEIDNNEGLQRRSDTNVEAVVSWYLPKGSMMQGANVVDV